MTDKNTQLDWRDNYRWYTHEPLISKVVKRIQKVIVSPFFSVEVVGGEHIPAQGACILTCNHVHNSDPFFVGSYLPRHPHYMAKVSLYKHPFFRWYFRMGASFPVYRKEKDAWAIRQAKRVLLAKAMLCIFPEGTRSRTGGLQQAKTGAVKLGIDHKVPVIPMAIIGSRDIRLRFRHQNKVRLMIDTPLDVATMAGDSPQNYGVVEELTELLMRRIAAMLPPENRGVYA